MMTFENQEYCALGVGIEKFSPYAMRTGVLNESSDLMLKQCFDADEVNRPGF
jgi:hypothetical protein